MNTKNTSYALLWSEEERYFDVRELGEATADALSDFRNRRAPDYHILAVTSSESDANELSRRLAAGRGLRLNSATFAWEDTSLIEVQ